jgi:hypothetical protein
MLFTEYQSSTTLPTHRSLYFLPVFADRVTSMDVWIITEPYIPLWLVFRKPILKLELGMLVMGRFGQAQVLCLSGHDRRKDLFYFLCYTFDEQTIFLCIPAKWQRGWQEKFRLQCKNILSRVFS